MVGLLYLTHLVGCGKNVPVTTFGEVQGINSIHEHREK